MRRLIPILLVALVMAACTSINCPLNNTVAAVWRFSKALEGSLTVTANLGNGNDTVIINSQSAVDSLSMPMSYSAAEDTFNLIYTATDGSTLTDCVRIKKTDTQHFESIECSPAVFHHIDEISCDGVFIDSVAIANPNVTYNTASANIIIYISLGDN